MITSSFRHSNKFIKNLSKNEICWIGETLHMGTRNIVSSSSSSSASSSSSSINNAYKRYVHNTNSINKSSTTAGSSPSSPGIGKLLEIAYKSNTQVESNLNIETDVPPLFAALSYFYNAKEVASQPFWCEKGVIGSEFRSFHTLIAVHVWLLHKRLLTLGKQGRRIQEGLFDELWLDTSNRIRSLGVGEISVTKHLQEVQGYTFKFCVELDEAISQSTDEEIIHDIGGALWRSLWLHNEDMDHDLVVKMAEYVYQEHRDINQISPLAMLEGRVEFGPMPVFDGVSKGSGKSNDSKKKSGNGVWKEAIASDGRKYYWNTASREATWNLPLDAEVQK